MNTNPEAGILLKIWRWRAIKFMDFTAGCRPKYIYGQALSVIFPLLLSLATHGMAAGERVGERSGNGAVLFVKETIAVSIVADDTLQVRGTYWFGASDSAMSETRLYYPFPVDTLSNYPFFIDIRDAPSSRAIAFAKQEQGVSFFIAVKPGDTTSVMVLYRQKVRNREGRYILTTTANWGRPLVDSRYSVRIPATLTLAYMSYECDSVSKVGKFNVYSFFKKQFMPDRDLFFRWQANGSFEKAAR